MSKLPSKSNISIPAGEVYFRPDGVARPYSLGHCKKFGWTPSVETTPIEVSTSGKLMKIGEAETKVEASVSLTLQELRPDILAMATAGKEVAYTQLAVTDENYADYGVKQGDLIDLGYLDVFAVTVSVDGVPLNEGSEYTLHSSAGQIVMRADLVGGADVQVVFSAPAISAANGRAAVQLLNATGLRGVFTVIALNETGKRYMLKNFRAVLRPTSEVPFHSDGTALVEVELEGSAEYNEEMPTKPWGELIELL